MIGYAWIFKPLCDDAAFTWQSRELSCRWKIDFFLEGGGGGFCYLNSPCIRKSITLMFMNCDERWVPVFVTKLRDRCFFWHSAATLVPLRWTPTFLLISRRWQIAPIWILAIVLAHLTPPLSQILDLFLMACQLKLPIDKKDEVQSDQLAIGASLNI